MKKQRKRFAAAALSVMIAMSSAGCSAATDILDQVGEKIPFLSGILNKEQTQESAAAGQTAAAAADPETASPTEPVAEEISPEEARRRSEGKILNIYCWDESLESLFIMYYPGYEDIGDRVGMIGDVTVNWVLPENGQEYMDLVAEKLLGAEYLTQDEKVDLYLAPEEDLAVYVNSDYSLDVKEKVGLTDEELEDQFPYTQQMASTDMGVLKAVTWQAAPGVFVYRRSIAKEVLGTDDPDAVQKKIADWNEFSKTAEEMKKKGYFMVSGYYDMFAAYRYGADKHWENRGTFVVPDAFTEWKNTMTVFGKKKYHNKTIMGQDSWIADQGVNGKVFGFFRAISDIDSKMAAYSLADADLAPDERRPGGAGFHQRDGGRPHRFPARRHRQCHPERPVFPEAGERGGRLRLRLPQVRGQEPVGNGDVLRETAEGGRRLRRAGFGRPEALLFPSGHRNPHQADG